MTNYLEHYIMLPMTAQSTSAAYIGTRFFGLPFWALISALSMILYKEFHVSAWQLTLLVALKPASSLLAVYWSSFNRKNLVLNLVLTNILRFVPFLFFFWVQSSLYVILAFGFYMTLSRGSMPAWMEIFKRHIPDSSRSRIFALGNTIEYVGTALLPLLLGVILDVNGDAWRWLFPLTAAVGIFSTLFLVRIPHSLTEELASQNQILLPWRRAWRLWAQDRSFSRYQLGFMLGGAGLMIIQPILPIFFVDNLHINYTQVMLAITICKGVGFALTSRLWSSYFDRTNIFIFSALVAAMAALFHPLLLASQSFLPLLYFAYLGYGVMQAGSELSWHMSAVTFSKKQESLPYSEMNIISVGIRGLIIPFLGNLIFATAGTTALFSLGSLLCLGGCLFLLKNRLYAIPN